MVGFRLDTQDSTLQRTTTTKHKRLQRNSTSWDFRRDRRKRISHLGRDVKRRFRTLHRIKEKTIPSHQWTFTQAANKATVAHFNVLPRQFPGETAFAPFHERSLIMGLRWHRFRMLAVHSYTPTMTLV